MATASLNLLHLPFSKLPPSLSFTSHQLSLPLNLKTNNSFLALNSKNESLLLCNSKSGSFNVEVMVEEDDDIPDDVYVSQFERECMRAGIKRECRRRRFHENAKEKRKRKSKERDRTRARERRALRSRRPGGGGGRYERNDSYKDDEDEEATSGVLAKLLAPDYVEGNIEVLDEVEFPKEIWEDDGQEDGFLF